MNQTAANNTFMDCNFYLHISYYLRVINQHQPIISACQETQVPIKLQVSWSNCSECLGVVSITIQFKYAQFNDSN